MVGVEGIADWIGQEVVDREGEKVGKLADVYYDTTSASPLRRSIAARMDRTLRRARSAG